MRFIGRREGISDQLTERMDWAEEKTDGNERITLFVAFNYGGRAEIVDAAAKYQGGGEEEFQKHLYAPEMHEPDLLIRTSGEQRISNYLLWQCAYSEFVFRDELWPGLHARGVRGLAGRVRGSTAALRGAGGVIEDLEPPSFQFGRGREREPEEPPARRARARLRGGGADRAARSSSGGSRRSRSAGPPLPPAHPRDVGDDGPGRRGDPLGHLRDRDRRRGRAAVHARSRRARDPRPARVLPDGGARAADHAARLRGRGRGNGDRGSLRHRLPDPARLRRDLPPGLRLRRSAAIARGDHDLDRLHDPRTSPGWGSASPTRCCSATCRSTAGRC